mmetsp:Transcript_14746/g.41939  ORF Transcript_14746/g.41939 Transcript_14746/m.41939 type:complete len:585 (-) Transcript_14746:57-1811(-)
MAGERCGRGLVVVMGVVVVMVAQAMAQHGGHGGHSDGGKGEILHFTPIASAKMASSPFQVRGGPYSFSWRVDEQRNLLNVKLKSRGSFAFAVSLSGTMIGADVALFNAAEGTVRDMHIGTDVRAVPDHRDDLQDVRVTRADGGGQVVEFSRPLQPRANCDGNLMFEDTPILRAPMTVLVSVGDVGQLEKPYNKAQWHAAVVDFYRGTVDDEIEAALDRRDRALVGDKQWRFRAPEPFKTPSLNSGRKEEANGRTEYNKILLYETLERPMHMTGFLVNAQTPVLHHIQVYVKHVPRGASHDAPKAEMGFQAFGSGFAGRDLIISWNRGSRSIIFPQEAGLYFEAGDWEIVLEYHYSMAQESYRDESEITLFLTSDLRPHNMSFLFGGFSTRSNSLGQTTLEHGRIDMYVDLPGRCFRGGHDGVRLFRNQFHMHERGVAAYLEHERNGKQLPMQGFVPLWNWGAYELTPATSMEKILPTDNLRLHCMYDLDQSEDSNKALESISHHHHHGVGQGVSFAAEMCLDLGYFYPATTRFTRILEGDCRQLNKGKGGVLDPPNARREETRLQKASMGGVCLPSDSRHNHAM